MKFVLLVVLAICASAAAIGHKRHHPLLKYEPQIPVKRSARNLPDLWMEQRLDNFNPQNLATFETRYFENDEFFAPNGPLLIYIGGEWTINQGSILGGHIYDMAEAFNASLFYPEHRYYGRSIPAEFENLSVPNLRFLTVEQALADLANFVTRIKRQPRYVNSRVIVVGGSYSATMAAWFRQLYPHLTVGAWASSAPVLAKVDFWEYKEITGAAYRDIGGRDCYDRIEDAFAAAEQMIRDDQIEEFRELFGLCEGFNSHPLDVWNAFGSFGDILAGPVQYNSQSNAINYVCSQLLNTTSDSSTALSEFAGYFRRVVGITGEACLENYEDTVKYFQDESLTSGAVNSQYRQWLYQTCTEFGWYQTSGSPFQPMGSNFPVDFYTQQCQDIYGETWSNATIHQEIDRKNTIFGAWNAAVTNVYFTNGMVDPWRAMGIQADLNPSSPADVIPGASHCDDLSSIGQFDVPEMVAVKHRISYLVRLWLGNMATPY